MRGSLFRKKTKCVLKLCHLGFENRKWHHSAPCRSCLSPGEHVDALELPLHQYLCHPLAIFIMWVNSQLLNTQHLVAAGATPTELGTWFVKRWKTEESRWNIKEVVEWNPDCKTWQEHILRFAASASSLLPLIKSHNLARVLGGETHHSSRCPCEANHCNGNQGATR